MAQITGEALTLGYDGKAVLRDLNFTVEAGDYLCIVGENGSGKTTLMKTLLGLQPPPAGQIRLGEGLTRKDIGYLPQQTEVQRDFPALVREIVRSGFQGRCGLRPFYTRQEKAEADRMLQKVGAAELAGRCYRELSGGQQQRVLLAVIIAVIIVLAMYLVGSLLISALVIFPALAAMRVCRSFLGVTVCAAVFSVVEAAGGILVAILAGTPVGATIVAVDMAGFGLFWLIGALRGGLA